MLAPFAVRNPTAFPSCFLMATLGAAPVDATVSIAPESIVRVSLSHLASSNGMSSFSCLPPHGAHSQPPSCGLLYVLQIPSFLFLFFIIAFCVVGQYTAVLLMRVKLQYHPDVTSYEGAARAISGPKFALFTRVLIITVWWSLLIVFLVGTADALKLLVRAGSKGLCQWQWTLIVLGAMVIPVQLTSLTQISWLAVPSSAAIVAAVIVVCVSLLLETDLSKFGSATLAGPIPFANFESFLVFMSAFSTVVFSYAGNTVFLELIHEMKRPEDFGKTVTLSYSIMVATYIFMMVVGYGVLGQRASKIGFIPDAVKTYAVRVVLGVLVSFHTAVAYLIISNPLHHTLYTFFFAKFPIEEGGIPARLRWLLMTLLVLTINFILGNAIPFFDSLLNLIGALLLGPAMLFFPAFFYTQACHNHATEISTFDKVCCYSLMYVITPLFVILCTMAAIDSIMTALKTAIIPFSC